MNRVLFGAAFGLGALAILWIGAGFIGSDLLALTVTLLIGLVYGIGCFEMLQYRQATASLASALENVPGNLDRLDQWLAKLPASLQNSVRLRIEGERIALPGPVFTPYLVGLLVMLGLLGTFIGMVVTLNGAVLALEGTTELQAMRAGLATPIKGLGLAFGTSVAGVAASAMLGLISTLSRRERLRATSQLDECIGNEFRGFSLHHHRQETYKALQFQAQALPDVAERLNAMAGQMESMTQSMTNAIVEGQKQFQETASRTFSELATSVEQSLKNSLAESGRLAGESIQPLVERTMQTLAEQAQQTQHQLQTQTQQQLRELTSQFSETAVAVGRAWENGLQNYDQRQQQLVASLDDSLKGFDQRFAGLADQLAAGVSEQSEQVLQRLGEGDTQRLQQWDEQFKSASEALVHSWEQINQRMLEQQQQALDGVNHQLAAVTESAERTSTTMLTEWSRILTQSGDMVRDRMQSEEQWLAQQADRMEQLTATLKAELTQLREQENGRAQAATERLGELESVVATHLTQLGSALEAPMLQLIETASEAPKAAAEVLEQLRREISNNIERDNELLLERQRIMSDLNTVLSSLESASAEQRAAIETLVTTSTQKLAEVSERFGQQVEGETDKLTAMADHLEASAVDISSLSEAFGYAVELFSESNDKLIENLNRVEAALDKSSSRSDEQLAYYVAQAREIIDLSMMSQKEIIEELRHKAEASIDVEEAVAEAIEDAVEEGEPS